MFERSRSPSLVWLSSNSIPSVFFDTRDENVRALLQSKERIQTIRDWDGIIAFAASDMLSLSAIENASRELAYAISLLVNASTSFNYISNSIASGDIFVGMSCFRFSLESIVRAGSIVLANENEREEILYRYENDVRDNFSINRGWVGEIDPEDTLAKRLGMILSNPLNDSGGYVHSEFHSRSEALSELPSKKSLKTANEPFGFRKLLDQCDLPIWNENSQRVRARIYDWHALSCSFLHADPFSSNFASRIRCDPNLKKTLLCEIYLDVTELLTDLFTGTVFHLLQELELQPTADSVRAFRLKFFVGNQE
ncbi:MAG: hypothetical protein RQ750_03150 [Roseovarius sp.]|nr:hypothetical protein [Roseovarius sp.]